MNKSKGKKIPCEMVWKTTRDCVANGWKRWKSPSLSREATSVVEIGLDAKNEKDGCKKRKCIRASPTHALYF